MFVIDTYLVSIDGGTPVRVPETNLESFIHVLLFNGFDSLTINKEDFSVGEIAQPTPEEGFQS